MVLSIEPRMVGVLGKSSPIELQPQPTILKTNKRTDVWRDYTTFPSHTVEMRFKFLQSDFQNKVQTHDIYHSISTPPSAFEVLFIIKELSEISFIIAVMFYL